MATCEANAGRQGDFLPYTPATAKEGGDVVQAPDGRAGVCTADIAAAALGSIEVTPGRIFEIDKAADVVVLPGADLWWDHSANGCTPVPPLGAGDLDFKVGTSAETDTVAASAAKVKVAINTHARYEIDTRRDNGNNIPVLTAGTPYAYNLGGMLALGFSLTAEAQKEDWLSKRSFPVSSNWIAEFIVEVKTNADADVADLDVGVANEIHASDFETVGEFAAFHFDMGADLNLDAHSDDGTTDIAPTDTTLDWAVGTAIHLVLDGRDHTDVRYYVNGVEVLNATANLGKLTAATGPLKLVVEFEKSSNDSPGEVRVWGGLRFVGNE